MAATRTARSEGVAAGRWPREMDLASVFRQKVAERTRSLPGSEGFPVCGADTDAKKTQFPRRTGSGADPGVRLRITVDVAAALTRESVRTWRRRAAREALAARRKGRPGLARKHSCGNAPGAVVWRVCRSIDSRLTKCPTKQGRDDRGRATLLLRYPQHAVEHAYRKAYWLEVWRRRCAVRRVRGQTDISLAAAVAAEAKSVEGDGFSISGRALKRWHRAYMALRADGQIAAVEGLIDQRSNPGAGEGSPAGRSPEAIEFFYSLYRTENKITVRTAHASTVRAAEKRGWAWPRSYSASRNWLHAHDDRSLSCLVRDGKDAWARRYIPHLEIDYRQIEPGQMYVCDHHQVDFWVEHQGKQLRPWLTAIQDCRSRATVGWHLGVAPHQDAILAALRKAFEEWSIPETMRIDNGKDFTSKLLTGVTKIERDRLRRAFGPEWPGMLERSEVLVVELIYAIPYAPWSKGTLERWFGTFSDQCAKTFVTYCGNSALTKPECLEEIRRGYSKAEKAV